jgi:hypothetical protein
VELSDSSSYIHRKFDGYVAGPWIAADIVWSGEMAPVTTNTLTTTGMPGSKGLGGVPRLRRSVASATPTS